MLHHGVGRKTIVREEVEAGHLSYQGAVTEFR